MRTKYLDEKKENRDSKKFFRFGSCTFLEEKKNTHRTNKRLEQYSLSVHMKKSKVDENCSPFSHFRIEIQRKTYISNAYTIKASKRKLTNRIEVAALQINIAK